MRTSSRCTRTFALAAALAALTACTAAITSLSVPKRARDFTQYSGASRENQLTAFTHFAPRKCRRSVARGHDLPFGASVSFSAATFMIAQYMSPLNSLKNDASPRW